MLNLFSNNESEIDITDAVWISEEQKWKACINAFGKNNATIFICWFDETYEKLKTVFNINNLRSQTILMARQANLEETSGKQIIFSEHHPLQKKEVELFEKLQLSTTTVYSSLDEPLFKQFGGDKIVSLLQQMGHKQEESIDHKMISQAIKTAQEKISEKVMVEIPANSQSDWLIKNLLA